MQVGGPGWGHIRQTRSADKHGQKTSFRRPRRLHAIHGCRTVGARGRARVRRRAQKTVRQKKMQPDHARASIHSMRTCWLPFSVAVSGTEANPPGMVAAHGGHAVPRELGQLPGSGSAQSWSHSTAWKMPLFGGSS